MEFVSYDIKSSDFDAAGAASSAIKEQLKRIGADAESIRRTMIAAYEAEMNVVIHAHGGRLEAALSETAIDVDVIDEGPGIPDIELAMKEGFSTASSEARALGFGAGLGLPNIKKNSDRLRVTSHVSEGTRVSFTVYLKRESACAPSIVSLAASAEDCRDCRRCLAACPTHAVRVRNGRPSILEHLCVDCTSCIAACSSKALTVRDDVSSLAELKNIGDLVLAVPPGLLASCGARLSPARVFEGLRRLGFADVITVAPFERALRRAALTSASQNTGDGLEARELPVISPVCPAVVNLIELKYPSLLPQLAPFDSPWEALQASQADRRVAYVVSCPGQRSALVAHEPADSAGSCVEPGAVYLSPDLVRDVVMTLLATEGREPATAGPAGSANASADGGADHSAADLGQVLTVTGMEHVMAVLEQIENGLLTDAEVVELYACAGGCFGSPLLPLDFHVTARRWAQQEPSTACDETPAALSRRRPYAARPGIRLDPDMARAIDKLGRMQALTRSLPGKDCGACGAPTCAALAEDVVMGRATAELCPYRDNDKEARDL